MDVDKGIILALAVAAAPSGQTHIDARALPVLRAVLAAAEPETGPILENGTKAVQNAAVEMTLKLLMRFGGSCGGGRFTRVQTRARAALLCEDKKNKWRWRTLRRPAHSYHRRQAHPRAALAERLLAGLRRPSCAARASEACRVPAACMRSMAVMEMLGLPQTTVGSQCACTVRHGVCACAKVAAFLEDLVCGAKSET